MSTSIETIVSPDRTPSPVIVSVFLRGGADGLHLVPPLEDDAYHRSRPTIAVAKSAALRLDGFFGLHPDLAPLHPLYQDGSMAIVHQCGTAEESRSHFEAEDYLHHGGLQGGGWLGRYLHHQRSPSDGPLTAVSIGPNVSDSLRGTAAVALQDLQDFTLPDKDPALRGHLAALYGKAAGPLGMAGRDTLLALERIESVRKSPDQPANGAVYPEGDFSRGLQLIARLVRARVGLRAATIELGGWDSHFTQLTLTAALLPGLAGGLAAFQRDLGTEAARVSTVVGTEFGRRVAENVSIGTDHGRAGVMLVLGGGVKGGRVLADWPTAGLAPELLEGPGDVPVRHATHHVLSTVLRRASPGADMTRIFPDLAAGEADV
ncbi:MAG: DUF1501 domain-containing protein [Verrucomicrobiota bacterium]